MEFAAVYPFPTLTRLSIPWLVKPINVVSVPYHTWLNDPSPRTPLGNKVYCHPFGFGTGFGSFNIEALRRTCIYTKVSRIALCFWGGWHFLMLGISGFPTTEGGALLPTCSPFRRRRWWGSLACGFGFQLLYFGGFLYQVYVVAYMRGSDFAWDRFSIYMTAGSCIVQTALGNSDCTFCFTASWGWFLSHVYVVAYMYPCTSSGFCPMAIHDHLFTDMFHWVQQLRFAKDISPLGRKDLATQSLTIQSVRTSVCLKFMYRGLLV
jgi:hypothetical protein